MSSNAKVGACFLLPTCLAYTSACKMEAVWLKCWRTFVGLHGVASHKTVFFTVITVRTWNLTFLSKVWGWKYLEGDTRFKRSAAIPWWTEKKSLKIKMPSSNLLLYLITMTHKQLHTMKPKWCDESSMHSTTGEAYQCHALDTVVL
jgi:hypothetical protein